MTAQSSHSLIDIQKLKTVTKKVFNDCLLPNGCLVAAPSHMPYYPAHAKSYLYSWPGRDNGFNLLAMAHLGEDLYEPVLEWLWERAEDFKLANEPHISGLVHRSYFPNGIIRESQFQPDQGATLIWSIYEKNKLLKKDFSTLETDVINAIANGYKRTWNETKFSINIEDLWEERELAIDYGNFTYSLSACAIAMHIAAKLLKDDSYDKISNQMRDSILEDISKIKTRHIPRHFGGMLKNDFTTDGSLSGLVWPFNIGFNDAILNRTLKRIENRILDETGVYRYHNDQYEGGISVRKPDIEAGSWPLLTFWLSIAYSRMGNKDKALKYFELPFKYIGDDYLIPEQIFKDNSNWEGIKPLLWSHSMAIFAAQKLGLL